MIRHAILIRMLSLYRHWFEELRLAGYFPEQNGKKSGTHKKLGS